MFGQQFLVAEHLKHVDVGLFAVQDVLNAALADYVLDLSAAESVVSGNGFGVLNLFDFREHILPDLQPCVRIGRGEPNLEQETTLEGGIEVVGEVGGGNEDAVESFHLLKYDVLHCVLHPF